eukprot:Clim_evm4s246 gene=Clim_evmTU4s246
MAAAVAEPKAILQDKLHNDDEDVTLDKEVDADCQQNRNDDENCHRHATSNQNEGASANIKETRKSGLSLIADSTNSTATAARADEIFEHVQSSCANIEPAPSEQVYNKVSRSMQALFAALYGTDKHNDVLLENTVDATPIDLKAIQVYKESGKDVDRSDAQLRLKIAESLVSMSYILRILGSNPLLVNQAPLRATSVRFAHSLDRVREAWIKLRVTPRYKLPKYVSARMATTSGLKQMQKDWLAYREALDGFHMKVLKKRQVSSTAKDNLQDALDAIDVRYIQNDEIKMEQMIGRGGFAQVFKGVWGGKPCAVKKFMDSKAPSQAALKRSFEHELKVMNVMGRHRQIVSLYGAMVGPKGELNIVMEYMPNGSLEVLLRRRRDEPFTSAEMWSFAHDIACGLSFLHAYDVIHRDLKPANILLDENMAPKLADFGIAKMKDVLHVEHSGDYSKLGSTRWRSPEVMNFFPCTSKSDVYAFGVILWQIMTRRIPYDTIADTKEVIARIQKGQVDPMPDTCADEFYCELVRRCRKFNPDARPNFWVIKRYIHEHAAPVWSAQRQYPASKALVQTASTT